MVIYDVCCFLVLQKWIYHNLSDRRLNRFSMLETKMLRKFKDFLSNHNMIYDASFCNTVYLITYLLSSRFFEIRTHLVGNGNVKIVKIFRQNTVVIPNVCYVFGHLYYRNTSTTTERGSVKRIFSNCLFCKIVKIFCQNTAMWFMMFVILYLAIYVTEMPQTQLIWQQKEEASRVFFWISRALETLKL